MPQNETYTEYPNSAVVGNGESTNFVEGITALLFLVVILVGASWGMEKIFT